MASSDGIFVLTPLNLRIVNTSELVISTLKTAVQSFSHVVLGNTLPSGQLGCFSVSVTVKHGAGRHLEKI
jgi:hypothetical protein